MLLGGGAVVAVGAGRITNGIWPGFTNPYFCRANRSISESVLSRFDSCASRAFSAWSTESCARALLVSSR